MEPQDLARDSAVTRMRVAPGWYTADLPPSWNFRTPSGGVLMTIAMRAMQQELGNADLRPVSANTHFCSPVPDGPIAVRVEVLRHGGAAAQLRAQLSSLKVPGPGLEVSATFGRDRDGIDAIDATPPAVPRPLDCDPLGQPPRPDNGFRPPFFDHYDCRLASGARWWEREGWSAGPARLARWFRYLVPQKLADGRLDPFALPPIADTMPPALAVKLGPGHEPFFAPSLDLTIHFLEDTRADWILTSAWVRRARGGFATAEIEMWDDAGTLVAVGTQMMILRRIPEASFERPW